MASGGPPGAPVIVLVPRCDGVPADHTDNSWEQMLQDSQNVLCLIDTHVTWSGPCQTMQPIFNRLAITTKSCNKRLKFYSLNRDIFMDKVQELCGNNQHFEPKGCKPAFLLVKNAEVKSVIVGVDSPTLLKEIEHHIPPVPLGD